MTKRLSLWPVILLLAVALAVLAGVLVLFPRLLYPPLPVMDLNGLDDPRARIELQQAQSRLANDARSTMLQGIAGLLLVVGAAATWWQVHISREGQITERFTRAVDQRNHATWPVGTPAGPEHPTATVDEHLPWMRVRAPDIQAAMGVLGRRAPARDQQVIYLSRVDLRSLALQGARLTGAKFRYSNLARAVLTGAHLDGSDLTAADLRRAYLERARLTNANLSRAYLQGANLRGADLRHTDLRGANLSDAILDEAVLTGAQADATTTWPAEIDAERRGELGVIEVSGDGSGPDSST